MSVVIDDQELKEFDEAIAKKRHKELLAALNSIGSELRRPPEDNGIQGAIEKHFQAISKLIEKIKPPDSKQPVINIETDNSEMINSFGQIADKLITEISGLKECFLEMNKPRSISFTRDRNGFIASPIELK